MKNFTVALLLLFGIVISSYSQTTNSLEYIYQFKTKERLEDSGPVLANIERIVVTQLDESENYSLEIFTYNDDKYSFKENGQLFSRRNLNNTYLEFNKETSLEIIISDKESKILSIVKGLTNLKSLGSDDPVVPSCLVQAFLYTKIQSDSNCRNGALSLDSVLAAQNGCIYSNELEYSLFNQDTGQQYAPKRINEGFGCLIPGDNYVIQFWGYNNGVFGIRASLFNIDLDNNLNLNAPSINGSSSKSCFDSETLSINPAGRFYTWEINGNYVGVRSSFTFDDSYPPGDYEVKITATCCSGNVTRSKTFTILSDCCSNPPSSTVSPSQFSNSFGTVGYKLCSQSQINLSVNEPSNTPFTSIGWSFTNHTGNSHPNNLVTGSFTQSIQYSGKYDYTVVNQCGFDQSTFYVYDCCGTPALSSQNQTIVFCDLDTSSFDLSVPIIGNHDFIDVTWTYVNQSGQSTTLNSKDLAITRSELGTYNFTINNGCGVNSGTFNVIPPASGCQDYEVSDCSLGDLIDIDILSGDEIELSLNDFQTNSLDVKLNELDISSTQFNSLLANIQSIRLEYSTNTGMKEIPLNIGTLQNDPYSWVDNRNLRLEELSTTMANVFIKNDNQTEQSCGTVEFRGNEDLSVSCTSFGCENQISLIEVNVEGGVFPIELVASETSQGITTKRAIVITNESQRIQQFQLHSGISGYNFSASDVNGGGLSAWCFVFSLEDNESTIFHHVESEQAVILTVAQVLSLITCTDFPESACTYWIKDGQSIADESILYSPGDALKLVSVIDGVIVTEIIISNDADGDTLIGESCTADNDSDGIVNCEDNDHDNDTVLNIDEDLNGNRNLFDDDANQNGIPAFLDPLETVARSEECTSVIITDVVVGTSDCFTHEVEIEVVATGENLEYSIDGMQFQNSPVFTLMLQQSYDIQVRSVEFNCSARRDGFIVNLGACSAEICSNDDDNDGDGFTSCEDLDCILLFLGSEGNARTSILKSAHECLLTCSLEDPSADLYGQMVEHAAENFGSGPLQKLIDDFIAVREFFKNCSDQQFDSYMGKGIVPFCFWQNATPIGGIGQVPFASGLIDGVYLEVAEILELVKELPNIILNLQVLQFQLYGASVAGCSEDLQCVRSSIINNILVDSGNETLSVEEFEEILSYRQIVFEDDYRQFFVENNLQKGCELLESLKMFVNTLLEIRASWDEIKQAYEAVKVIIEDEIKSAVDDVIGDDVEKSNIVWYKTGKFTVFVGSFFTGIGTVTKIPKIKKLLDAFKKFTSGQWMDFRRLLREFLGIADNLGDIKALLVNKYPTILGNNKVDDLASDFLDDIDVLKGFLLNSDRVKAWDGLFPSATLRKNADALTEADFLLKKGFTKSDLNGFTTYVNNAFSGTKNTLISRINSSNGFNLIHNDSQIQVIMLRARSLDLSPNELDDLLFTSSRVAKQITAMNLMRQMDNWVNIVKVRGYPYLFSSVSEYDQFGDVLKKLAQDFSIPSNKFNMQGSSLRNSNIGEIGDLDIAYRVDNVTFDNLVAKFLGATTNQTTVENIIKDSPKGVIRSFNMLIDPQTNGSFKGRFFTEFENVFGSSYQNYFNKSSSFDIQITIIKKGAPLDVSPFLKFN